MSSKVATLVVGLLAIAEGRSTDRNMLREANNDEVLNVISPELLDRVAKQLYAEDQANLSAYERLMANDKRKKMDYLNNIRPDLIPESNDPVIEENRAPLRPADDHVQDNRSSRPVKNQMPNQEQIEEVLRHADETHEMLTKHKAESERHRLLSI